MNTSHSNNQTPRRVLAHISLFGICQLHLRNPNVVAFWSAMFPGAGHFILSRYLRGYILFFWEFFVNAMAHVNLALYYTLLGKIDMVKDVVDIRWSLMYVPAYLFAIWDSYRSADDLNKHYALAMSEDAPVQPFVISALGINALDKCPPFVPPGWCLLTPGLGQLMLHRFTSGFFILVFWIVVVYYSKVLPAICLTCSGQFDAARSTLNIQWFLNIPSVYFFCSYATYVATVEHNKLFDWEQTRFLRKNYQSAEFPFPEK
jgi:hypothetical protein